MSARAKPALRAYWSKRERDVMYWHDRFPPDGHLMHQAFSNKQFGGSYPADRVPPEQRTSFLEELERRGYDLTTLRFSIRRKAVP